MNRPSPYQFESVSSAEVGATRQVAWVRCLKKWREMGLRLATPYAFERKENRTVARENSYPAQLKFRALSETGGHTSRLPECTKL